MRIKRSLFSGIFAAISILVTPTYLNIALAQLPPQEISAIAKPITVRIDGANEGSGVIIEKSNNTYTVITNWHVVKIVGDYTVQTFDGRKHPIDYQQTQQLSENADLAIVKFTSTNNYEVANLGESQNLGEGQTIHLAGYPGSEQIIGESDRFYRFYNLSLVSILPIARDGGYTLSYAGENFSGMSGSPILDSNGNIIGINGTSYVDLDGKARSNYAIPINTYKELAVALTSKPQQPSNPFQDYLENFNDPSPANSLIRRKLDPIPVFTIADDEGKPLVANNDGEKVTGIFISQQDAYDFVDRLQTKNPDLAQKVRVTPVSLGEVYKITKGENDLEYAYVPQELAVNDAKNLGKYENGVPLFVAKGGADNGYLTVEKDGKQVIPFFFELEQLENMLQKFREQKPELASTINLEIVLLEGVINTLESNDDPLLEKIVLVPSSESLEFLQKTSSFDLFNN